MATKKLISQRSARTTPPANLTNPLPPGTPTPPAAPVKSSPQPIVGWANANSTNVWIPVDAYLVRHYGWQTSDVAGCMASVICYSSGVLVGYVNFFNTDHVPQSTINSFSPPQLVLTISYPVERVQEVLDTLRCEAQVHIGVDLSQRIGWLGIDPAPVGHVPH